ncbi:MAG: hypothetical protein WB763_07985 [Terriglobia bacterium]|jgi:hypothetical protein
MISGITFNDHLLTRLEYGRDMSNRPSLFKGTTPADHHDTITGALIYTFDLKELHP